MTARARTAGMTLVEVLCALVLLSALAAASLPLLVETNRVAHEKAPAVSVFELGRFADAVAADAEAGPIAWPDHPERRVEMRRIFVGDPPTHAWLVFACEGIAVSRWEAVKRP